MRIHIHTDCEYFAGCERIIADVLTAEHLCAVHEISLSFRTSPRYLDGLPTKIKKMIKIYPIKIPIVIYPTDKAQFLSRRLLVAIRVLSQYFLGPFYFLIGFFRIVKVLRIASPDVIYINNGGYPGSRSARAAALSARAVGIKTVIMRVHNFAMPYNKVLRICEYPLDLIVKKCVSKFICGSHSSAKQLTKVLRINKNKVQVIYNGIPWGNAVTESFSNLRKSLLIKPEIILVGVVGALEERKGINDLFEALFQLSQTKDTIFRKIFVVVIGTGPDQQHLEMKLRSLGLNDAVRLIGHQHDASKLIAELDILIVPSTREEDTPNVIYEAMMCGVPVIASNIGGISEQIEHEVSGILVRPGHLHEIQEALEKMVLNKQLRAQYGKEAEERFRRMYSVDLAIEKHLELFRSLGVA